MSTKESVQTILQRALERMQSANKAYSLRALAQKIDISPSYLSKVFRGLKPLTPSILVKLEKPLNLDLIEVSTLQTLILDHIEDKYLTTNTGLKVSKQKGGSESSYKHLGKEDFFLLEKWFYLPFLNLITTEGFQNDAEFISSRLGISIIEVKETLRQFKHFGYICEEDGCLSVDSEKCRFPTNKSYESIRNHHKGMMKKAMEELDKNTSSRDFESRLINGISFAGDPEKIKQAQDILNKAIYQVAELLSAENPQEVFQLNVQFFKITKD